jgi:nucleoid DNA-binding protein
MKPQFRQQENLLTRDLYEHYKKTRRKVAAGANQYTLYLKCVAGLINTISELLLENDNGVYIEGFGYFYVKHRGYTYSKKVSIIRKKELNVHKARFEFFDEELNKKYNFRLNNRILDLKDNNKNFEYKKDAIKHYLQTIKQ